MCEECRRLTTSMRNVIRKIKIEGPAWPSSAVVSDDVRAEFRAAEDRNRRDTRLIVADVIQQILNEAEKIR